MARGQGQCMTEWTWGGTNNWVPDQSVNGTQSRREAVGPRLTHGKYQVLSPFRILMVPWPLVISVIFFVKFLSSSWQP
jgi:hypothetical protein